MFEPRLGRGFLFESEAYCQVGYLEYRGPPPLLFLKFYAGFSDKLKTEALRTALNSHGLKKPAHELLYLWVSSISGGLPFGILFCL